MRLLIAGSAGYIGSALVPKLLDRGLRGLFETLKLLSRKDSLRSFVQMAG
jgi:nucleoside-diphosphate-sugar epimerase